MHIMKKEAVGHMTRAEREIGLELFNIGLGNSADSFSGIVKDQVLITQPKFNFRADSRNFRLPLIEDGESYVVTTKIAGDIPGASYLMFDQQAIEEVSRLTLSSNLQGMDSQEKRIMQEAMLLEMDNILTASVITHLANFFNVFMYGAVPEGVTLSALDTRRFLREQKKAMQPNVVVSTRFKTANLPNGPRFVWYWGGEFVDAIQQLSNRKGIKALIQNVAV